MTAERIEATLTVRYGDASHTGTVTVPIDVGQPWMTLGAGVVTLARDARAVLYDLVDRDRQALADQERRGGVGTVESSDTVEPALDQVGSGNAAPPRLLGDDAA